MCALESAARVLTDLVAEQKIIERMIIMSVLG